MKDPAPTERNRLKVAALLLVGGLLVAGWAAIDTDPDVTGVLGTLVTWVTAAVAVFSAWSWLRSDGDRWHLPFALTGLLTVGGSLAALLVGETPRLIALLPFFGSALWLAVRIERARVTEWRRSQTDNRERTFSAADLRDDPLVDERERTRRTDATNQYPATLRELKARLRQSDGDPWA